MLARELMVRYYDPLYEHTRPDRPHRDRYRAGGRRAGTVESGDRDGAGKTGEQKHTSGLTEVAMSRKDLMIPRNKCNKLCRRCVRACRQQPDILLLDCPRFLPLPFKIADHALFQLDLFAEES